MGDGEWKQIRTAPLDRDLELAVIDTRGTHLVAFPCRRLTDDRWVDVAVAKEGVEIARVTDPGAGFRRNIRALRSAALGRCARPDILAVSRGRRLL